MLRFRIALLCSSLPSVFTYLLWYITGLNYSLFFLPLYAFRWAAADGLINGVHFSALAIAERVERWYVGTFLIRHPYIQLDSGVMDPDCKSKMVRGLNRRVDVEYNSYVALALGIGDPSLLKRPHVGLRGG